MFSALESHKELSVSDKLLKVTYKVIDKMISKYDTKRLKMLPSKKSGVVDNAAGRMPAKKPVKNGIAIFSISAEGKISRSPEQVIVRNNFCRLENIDIFGNTCVITDLVNRSLSLYKLNSDPKLINPVQTINLANAAPHGAKFSPDGRWLIISCLGLKIIDQEPRFFDWELPREDKIFVFERES
jgi:hypothetical protein